MPRDELLQFNNHLLNYTNEAGLNELPGAGLSPDYVAPWQQTRAALEKQREARRQQRRFRRDPVNYLKRLEELAIQLSLLS